MKTVALIIGHSQTEQGAVSVSGVSEFNFNSALVPEIAARLDRQRVKPVVLYREHGYAALPGEVNASGADLAVEFHFNAADGRAGGTEVLCWYKSVKGHAAAELMQRGLVAALSLRDRGIKPCSANDRGGTLLAQTNMPCLIAEPFFGDNSSDWQRALERRGALIAAYAAAIEQICAGVL